MLTMPLRRHARFFVVPLLFALTGCELKKPPPTLEYTLHSPYATVRTFAIGPTANLSPSRDFDGLSVSDAIFEQCQSVDRLNVIPVNKTLAAMQILQMRSINSPEAAERLANFLNADAVIVPAVTAYDPYTPPTVGMTLQLYAGTNMPNPTHDQPVTQVAAIFNANNQTTLRELSNFVKGRTDYDSALQEKRYLADADSYMKFVANAMVRRLLDAEGQRTMAAR
jgi:hypothetical protein